MQLKRNLNFKFTCLTPLFVLIGAYSYAQTLKGKVTDGITGEPLIGATVSILQTDQHKTVLLDGGYSFKKVKPGSYSVQVKYLSYHTQTATVTVKKESETLKDFALIPQINELNDVNIISASASNESRSRSIEKNANQLVNVFSARTIQLLPDITVANVMQRVPGIVIDRSNNGEGRYPVIRGMDKRYNTTLVNGIKIPSPDNNNRYVPLDLFPADLLERLEVSKSLIPSMEGDAIGGTINMVMKDAPRQLLVQANASAGYSTILNAQPFQAFDHSVINKKSPGEINGPDYNASPKDFPAGNLSYRELKRPINKTFGLTLGDRFGEQKQFGVIVSASYQDIYRGTNTNYFFPNTQPGLENTPVFADVYLRQYSTQNKRIGLYSNMDYLINAKHKITWFNMYLRTEDFQSRATVDSVRNISFTGPGNGNVNLENRSTWQIQQIYNSTLKGTHYLSKRFIADWSAVYSAAKNEIPDYASFTTQHGVSTDANGKQTETTYYLSSMSRRWTHNTDRDAALYANLTFNPKQVFNSKAEFKIGGLYRHKNRDNYYNQYDLDPSVPSGSTNQAYTDIFNAQFAFKGSDGGKSGDINANTYNVQEDITAGYLQGKLNPIPKLEIIGGLRVEHTRNHYETVQPNTVQGKAGTIYYTDLLPSVQFKYSLTAQQALRLAYYKAISRPGYFEIVPTLISGEYYNEAGNYDLNRSRADNVDLRYEFFPGAADQVLIGAFYKRIKDPIEAGLAQVSGTNTTQVLKPFNYGAASNYGAEIAATKYFGHFGVSANYTYTHSRITTPKSYYYRKPDNSTGFRDIDQTRPLQGQADHIANLSFIYKDPALGLDAQIAYVYTGKRIIVVSPYYGLDYWQRPFNQLDFSVEKKVMKLFSVYSKVTNITNSHTKVDVLQPNTFLSGRDRLPMQEDTDKILVQNTFYKPSFLLGLRYKFN
ncbi:TonB-dependent receptor [Pedobacter sp. MC2016-24]|uniref:TonB-dependent receptor n=1 Tax=Pedobacter sp. MC2016-24 TaxID=2780090 RepID=UPI001881E7D3|nr:TonB-dependent receptor [Pedobacter sp. MC2016-24]MBE9598621.1 TonB-dependent receptor plug domain-containing protein [Pedobacter sp. MC2016-24]